MNAALEVREERSFEVNADGTGYRGVFCGAVDETGEAGERAECVVDGSGDSRGEKSAGAARGEEATDGVECGGCGFHNVVAECAVDVDVEEGGREGCAGEVEDVGTGGGFSVGARGDGEDAAIFDDEDGVVEEVGAVPEFRGGDDRAHRKQLLQAHAERVSKSASQQVSEWLLLVDE